jgi:glucose-6-phosphate 1-dehydrogenase
MSGRDAAAVSSEPSDALVFFGATGDLAYKQVFPALQAMARCGELQLPVIGVARQPWTREQLVERARASVAEQGGVDADAFEKLAARLHYVAGDYTQPATYAALKQALGEARRPLHYLAIPPSLFGTVVDGLRDSGCARGGRVVVEKPFGRSGETARGLDRILHAVFAEEAIFRIDHFLGKEAVQNLLYFRFANRFPEPVWTRGHVEAVHLDMAEDFGVQGRGALYEEMGAIRDVVQNHLLQVLVLLAMDAPAAADARSMHAEKLRLLRAVRPLQAGDVLRGQYRGYREEAGVAPDSQVETFAALRLHVDNWRWAGVPFHIRTGKRLQATRTEVRVQLKDTPVTLFDPAGAGCNYFRFQLSPQLEISLGARVKRPGDPMAGEAVELLAQRQPRGKSAYERLLGDALRGDSSLFTCDECMLAAWDIVDPVLQGLPPPTMYEPGSAGPPC